MVLQPAVEVQFSMAGCNFFLCCFQVAFAFGALPR